jgi:rubrerythrin
MSDKQKVQKVRCPYCGYEWVPRKSDPVECPMCKRYFVTEKPELVC